MENAIKSYEDTLKAQTEQYDRSAKTTGGTRENHLLKPGTKVRVQSQAPKDKRWLAGYTIVAQLPHRHAVVRNTLGHLYHRDTQQLTVDYAANGEPVFLDINTKFPQYLEGYSHVNLEAITLTEGKGNYGVDDSTLQTTQPPDSPLVEDPPPRWDIPHLLTGDASSSGVPSAGESVPPETEEHIDDASTLRSRYPKRERKPPIRF